MPSVYLLLDPQTQEATGPFDLLSIIRRIKRGTLRPEHLVQVDDGEPVAAENISELKEIFDDEENAVSTAAPEFRRRETFGGALRSGWETFRLNQSLAVLTGVFIIVAVLGLTVFSLALDGVALGVASSVWINATLTFYLAAMLRKARMQLLQGSYFGRLFKKNAVRLLIGSTLIVLIPGVLPALLWPLMGGLAFFLVAIPGTLILTYFMFVPLVVIDRETGLREAFRVNNRKMRQGGLDAYTVMYGLFVLNIIFPLLPITMPVTYIAMCDLYDRLFNEQ